MPRCASSKHAGAAVVRAGEGALLVPEDLALEQRLGNRRAVHRHERERRARTQLVDGLRDELLAGARLAPDENRGGGRRGLLDHAIHRPDARAVADDPAEAPLLAQLPPEIAHFAQRLLPLDRLLQQNPQALRVHRLTQVVVGAVLDRLHGALDRPLCRQQDERQVGELVLQSLEEIVAAHPRHDEVADDDRGPETGDTPERLFAVGGFVGLKSPVLYELGESGAGRRIVFDNEHSFAGAVGECVQVFHVYKLCVSVPVLGKNYTLRKRKFSPTGV